MRKSRYSNSQIIEILKKRETGVSVNELCEEYGMSSAQFYKWNNKFKEVDISEKKRLKQLEEENTRLKKIYAEERLKVEVLIESLEEKCNHT